MNKAAFALFLASVLLVVSPVKALLVSSYDATVNSRYSSGFPSAPVANTSTSFVGATFDFSGVGWQAGAPCFAVTLISPQNFVTALHVSPAIGSTVVFLNRDGVLKSYTVASLSATVCNSPNISGNSDLVVGTLSTAVTADDHITTYPILSIGTPLSTNLAGYSMPPLLVYGQSGTIGINVIAGFMKSYIYPVGSPAGSVDILYFYTFNDGVNGQCQGQGGDSGSPTFAVADGVLTLVGVHSAIGLVGSNPNPATFDNFLAWPSILAQIANITAASGQDTTIYIPGTPATAGRLAGYSVYSAKQAVVDTIAPALTLPINITAEATSAAGASVTFTATATDNIDGAVAVTLSPASGSVFPIGTTAVFATAQDAAGNIASGVFSVTVSDSTAPELELPSDIVTEATSAAGAIVSFTTTATDDIDGAVAVTLSPASGSVFPVGTTAVFATAQDAAGNTITGTFNVTVNAYVAPVPALLSSPAPTTLPVKAKDTTAPKISSLTASSTHIWPADHQMVAITLSARATDNIGVTSLKIISATSSERDSGLGKGDLPGDIAIKGAMNLSLRAESFGSKTARTYTITVEARDAAGNKATRAITLSVTRN